jgi:TPP-dependent 2-oxoacid decarboxylase
MPVLSTFINLDLIGYDVRSEKELEGALKDTQGDNKFAMIEVHTDKWDCTPALKVAGEEMRKKNQA